MDSETPSTSNPRPKKKSNGRYCCVVNCSVNQRNKPEGTIFYSFPELSQKQTKLWIKAVNRKNPDGSDWIPKKSSFICSNHFVGGKKSTLENHPAFVPTIFPDIYRVKTRSENDCYRFERAKRRQNEREVEVQVEMDTDTNTEEAAEHDFENPDASDTEFPNCKEVQTEFFRETFFNKSTQTFHKVLKNAKTETDTPYKPSTFFNELKSDKQYVSWFGVTKGIFYVLLDLIKPKMGRAYKLTNEERLGIVLVKFKSGLSFLAMTSIFHVDEMAISRNFYSILDLLYDECKDLIVWPTRSQIKRSNIQHFSSSFDQLLISNY